MTKTTMYVNGREIERYNRTKYNVLVDGFPAVETSDLDFAEEHAENFRRLEPNAVVEILPPKK